MSKAVKVGVVTGNKMDKTVVVAVERLVRHPLYKRAFKKTSTFMAHDEGNQCKIGDRVRIIESRPLSSRKRWRVLEILEKPTPSAGGPGGATAAVTQDEEENQVGA